MSQRRVLYHFASNVGSFSPKHHCRSLPNQSGICPLARLCSPHIWEMVLPWRMGHGFYHTLKINLSLLLLLLGPEFACLLVSLKPWCYIPGWQWTWLVGVGTSTETESQSLFWAHSCALQTQLHVNCLGLVGPQVSRFCLGVSDSVGLRQDLWTFFCNEFQMWKSY